MKGLLSLVLTWLLRAAQLGLLLWFGTKAVTEGVMTGDMTTFAANTLIAAIGLMTLL